MKKFLLDQTFGNVAQAFLFIAIMTSLRGGSFDEVVESVRQGLRRMVHARMGFWPAAAMISFTVIPPQQRVLFNNVVGMTWVSILW